jgi:hypothetical protein
VPARAQTDGPDTEYEPEPGLLRAHAEIFTESSPTRRWLPSDENGRNQHYIDLKITPKKPPAKEKKPAKERKPVKRDA